MHNKAEIAYLADCRLQIEARLGWGDSGLWTSRDFEALSEKILEATHIHLSATTLKRIWGKVKYDSLPAITTLDTLAQFAGYENWRAFRQDMTLSAASSPQGSTAANTLPPPASTISSTIDLLQETASDKRNTPLSGNRLIWVWTIAGMGAVIVLLGFYFARKKTSAPAIDPSQYQFSSKKVLTEGVPNSVVFDYEASASPFDSVYIQQSWDPARRKKVSKHQRQFTSVYYYPGFFKAKLMIGKQIVKEHELLIKTKGWLPIIEQTPVPVYFEEKEAMSGTELELPVEKIREKNIPLQPQTPWIRYANVGNWGDLQTDSFRLEATVKNEYREGSAICQNTEIRILCDGSAIIIPLCDKGCVSELNMLVLARSFSGKEQDLSFLGVDFHDWIHVVCTGGNGMFRLFLDNRLVFQSPLPAKPVAIKGIDLRFQGTGRIRNVTLSK